VNRCKTLHNTFKRHNTVRHSATHGHILIYTRDTPPKRGARILVSCCNSMLYCLAVIHFEAIQHTAAMVCCIVLYWVPTSSSAAATLRCIVLRQYTARQYNTLLQTCVVLFCIGCPHPRQPQDNTTHYCVVKTIQHNIVPLRQRLYT